MGIAAQAVAYTREWGVKGSWPLTSNRNISIEDKYGWVWGIQSRSSIGVDPWHPIVSEYHFPHSTSSLRDNNV